MDQLIDKKLSGFSADIPSVFTQYAASQPDNAAILAPGRAPLSFAALHAQQLYARDALGGWGLDRRDAVAVVMPKGPEMAAAIAVLPVSATVVPLDPNLSEEDYARLFTRCFARALILPKGQAHNARIAAGKAGLLQIDLSADPDAPAGTFELDATGGLDTTRDGGRLGRDTAYIVGTSGTTSERKLIPMDHEHMITAAQATKSWYGLDAGDISIQLTPMYFAHGIKSTLMSPLLSGTSIVCPVAYRADSFFAMLEEFRPTWLTASFAIYRDILRNVDKYKEIMADTHLRFMRASSGRLEPDEIRRLEEAFDTPLIVGLSSTESGWIAVNPLPPQQRKYGSVGLPTINEVRVRAADGRFVDPGHEGEIVVRGPLVFDGYLDDPAATGEVFVDGWYRTGDLGNFDEDGFLFLTGRIKDVINRGGEKISPAEIDKMLECHPAVAEGAAFGMPHPTLGEIVVAAVVPKFGMDISERDLKQYVRTHLAASKAPNSIYFLDRLPRAENGKLQRNKLLEFVRKK